MATLLIMAGGLIPTFLISRLFLWMTRSWRGGIIRLVTVHGFSWVLIALVAGMGMADGGAFAGVEAAALYGVPQAAWLVFDIVRNRIRARRGVKTDAISN